MSDFLLSLGKKPAARKVVKQLGLPIPLPQTLARELGPWVERPLEGQLIAVAHVAGAQLANTLAHTLGAAGAKPWVVGAADDPAVAPYAAAGEAWGTPPEVGEEIEGRPAALILDATGVARPDDLKAVYQFFQPRVRSLARCGRVVVLGRPSDQAPNPAAAATAHALEGFVRSVAKEVGRTGATAQLITIEPGAEAAAEPVLRFVLSKRSAYLSGQPLRVRASVAPAQPPTTRALDGKVALVTGAARGIGAATARALAREGARVIVLDRPADDGPASKVAEEIGGSVLLCDVTADDAADTIATAIERFGGVDIIIHNAGVTRDRTLAKMDEARWDMTIGVNLDAVIRITERLDGLLRDGARVVCLSSIAGIAGNFGQTNYAASKSGILGYVEALAPTLAGRGIAVSGVAPGFIETRLTKAIPTATREVARRLSALGQGGLPADVAEVLVFLSSPGGGALSGQVVRVCGGAFVGS